MLGARLACLPGTTTGNWDWPRPAASSPLPMAASGAGGLCRAIERGERRQKPDHGSASWNCSSGSRQPDPSVVHNGVATPDATLECQFKCQSCHISMDGCGRQRTERAYVPTGPFRLNRAGFGSMSGGGGIRTHDPG
jgi:hypothetical protein